MPPPRPRYARRPVKCQHCERDIWQRLDGHWEDSDHFTQCMTFTPLAYGQKAPVLYHQPMPAII